MIAIILLLILCYLVGYCVGAAYRKNHLSRAEEAAFRRGRAFEKGEHLAERGRQNKEIDFFYGALLKIAMVHKTDPETKKVEEMDIWEAAKIADDALTAYENRKKGNESK